MQKVYKTILLLCKVFASTFVSCFY